MGDLRIKIQGRPFRISQIQNGNIFISTRYNGIYELAWSESKSRNSLRDNYSLIHYDTLCGLPSLTLGALTVIQDKIYVVIGDQGLYYYDKFSQSFKRDSSI